MVYPPSITMGFGSKKKVIIFGKNAQKVVKTFAMDDIMYIIILKKSVVNDAMSKKIGIIACFCVI